MAINRTTIAGDTRVTIGGVDIRIVYPLDAPPFGPVYVDPFREQSYSLVYREHSYTTIYRET